MAKTIPRQKLAEYMDAYLRVAEIDDASPNGLQVEGASTVSKVAFAVDASVQTIRAAAKAKAQMLVVHHGLWWGKHEQIVGNMRTRIATLIETDVSLYAAHLPLDCHPEVGNNVELARVLDLRIVEPFGHYKGVEIGVIAEPADSLSRDAFVARVRDTLEAEPDVLPFGPEKIRRVGILSGGGAMYAEVAKHAGCDTLLTGETAHAAYHLARESKVNLVHGGHYATETVGLRALERHLKEKFEVATRFIPAPTGY